MSNFVALVVEDDAFQREVGYPCDRTSTARLARSVSCRFRTWARATRMSALRLRKRTSPHRLAIFGKAQPRWLACYSTSMAPSLTT